MAKQVSNKILENILQIVKRFSQGASLEDILQALFPPLPRRSLQRYLSILAMEGRRAFWAKLAPDGIFFQ